MYKENLKEWKNANLPNDLKLELESLNEHELQDAFYRNLNFGTGGLRGIMGVGTNRINEFTIKKSTQGYANYLNSKFKNPSVAISYDNRNQSDKFALIAAKVLAANNIKVYITPKLRPTPFLSYLIRYFNTNGGIMITASHNPKEYNGYKVYEPYGGQLNLESSEKVIAEINKITNIFNIKEIENELINWVNLEKMDEIYLNEVKKISFNTFNNPATVIYSPLHGTGGTLIPKLLKSLNYNYYSYEPHMVNDGNFPNTKSANPEDKVAYIDAIEFAKKVDGDIIILTDPDADRIGAAVKHNNDYIILNGNQLAIVTLSYLLDNLKDIKNGHVFMSNVTSSLIETLAIDYNLKVVKTLPGFKFIAEEMTKLTKDETYVFGCEESNGNIISPIVYDKDAVQATLMLAELASFVKANNLSLVDYLNNIYKKYGYYYEETLSFEFKGLEGTKQMENLMTYLRENKVIVPNNDILVFTDVLNKKIYNLKDNTTIVSTLEPQNILRFEYTDESWLMARPSGTEPKLKVYFSVKGNSLEDSKQKIKKLQNIINDIIKNIN